MSLFAYNLTILTEQYLTICNDNLLALSNAKQSKKPSRFQNIQSSKGGNSNASGPAQNESGNYFVSFCHAFLSLHTFKNNASDNITFTTTIRGVGTYSNIKYNEHTELKIRLKVDIENNSVTVPTECHVSQRSQRNETALKGFTPMYCLKKLRLPWQCATSPSDENIHPKR